MKILIGADIVPTSTNYELFRNARITDLLGQELQELLLDDVYSIFNLEVPITDKESPIEKQGPNLIAPCDTMVGIKAMGIDLFTLANNHILDQDVQGLESTCRLLKENKISYVGAGNTIDEASEPHIFMFGNKKVGVYACAEHEFTIVSKFKGGANPFEPLDSIDDVRKLKEKCDYVIVLYHGGKEHYRYPSPYLQKVCRKFVDGGADLVVCQHSHCIGCMEEYSSSVIVYGQGNFLFDRSNLECWGTGLLIEIDDELNVSFIPIKKNKNTIRLAKGEQKNEILSNFIKRSEEIKKNGFVEERYVDFAKELSDSYLIKISGMGRNIIFRILNKLTARKIGKLYVKFKYNKSLLLLIENYISCEAHREILERIIKDKYKRNK